MVKRLTECETVSTGARRGGPSRAEVVVTRSSLATDSGVQERGYALRRGGCMDLLHDLPPVTVAMTPT
jgi:hypothetical protein